MTKPKTKTAKGEQVALRLSSELLDRAVALQGRLVPGVELTRSDVLRAALARGLAELEAALARKRGERDAD
jgi:hypothetical protein